MPRKSLEFGDRDRTRVLIEPTNAEAAQGVRRRLEAIGSTRVEELTAGFISAEVPTGEIEKLRHFGRVNIVRPKQFRDF
jgi:hypothetical protein